MCKCVLKFSVLQCVKRKMKQIFMQISQFLNVGGGGEGQHGRINKTGLQAEASSLPDSLRPLESTMLSLSLTMKE